MAKKTWNRSRKKQTGSTLLVKAKKTIREMKKITRPPPYLKIEARWEGRTGRQDGQGVLCGSEGVPPGRAHPRQAAPLRRQRPGTAGHRPGSTALQQVREYLGYRHSVTGGDLTIKNN